MTDTERAEFEDMKRRLDEAEKVVAAVRNLQISPECGGGRAELTDQNLILHIDQLRKSP